MFRRSATLRISFTLASMSLCAILAALALGLLPDRVGAIGQGRAALCESLAISCSYAVQRGEWSSVEPILKAVAIRNRDLISAALRRSNGQLAAVAGDHKTEWPQDATRSTLTHMHVPISLNKNPCGRLELCFAASNECNWTSLSTSVLRLTLFIISASFLAHFLYLRRVLQHLDPSKVIPDRVRATLDSLAEGLLVLDRDERIVLANKAFARTVGQTPDELQGHRASDLPWSGHDDDTGKGKLPWERAIRDGAIEKGQVVRLGRDEASQRILQVNSAPIRGENGKSRGAIASFSDVTALDVRNTQLGETLTRLERSRDQIIDQNEQLRVLAMIDPLTKCLNRRAFFQELENQLCAAKRTARPVSYIIMDIDLFKLVNDNHGHKVGDEVLEHVGRILQATVENRGFVCRYGGEEFSILMPNSNATEAFKAAERIRERIASAPIADLKITASLGVMQFDVGCAEPLQTLDHADRALYFAKRSGRNRVVRWDQIPSDVDFRAAAQVPDTSDANSDNAHIPFTAVSVLLSALDHRNAETAEHSRRVADLCVAMAAGLVSEEQRYVLEVAALLHDMGKLSVPDSILHKPGPLTPEEWKVVDTHLRLGEKTVENAFASQPLVGILRNYRAAHGGTSHRPELPTGDDIPLCARILRIADAYDAMTSYRTYRDAMSREEAFAELRRCAGTDFDPDLVERCVSVIESRDEGRVTSGGGFAKGTAFRIGLLLDKLVCAIDGEDVTSLAEMVGQMKVIAERDGIDAIANLAEDIHHGIADDASWTEVLQASLNLLDLCRQNQHTHVLSSETVVPSPQRPRSNRVSLLDQVPSSSPQVLPDTPQ